MTIVPIIISADSVCRTLKLYASISGSLDPEGWAIELIFRAVRERSNLRTLSASGAHRQLRIRRSFGPFVGFVQIAWPLFPVVAVV